MSVFASSYATPYAASKGGIVQLARSMAVAWAKDNIQVNAILPGWIDTDLTRKAREQVEGLNERVLARTPGSPGRFRRHRRFSGGARFEFHHRRGNTGRWRLLGADLMDKSALCTQNGLSPIIVQRRMTRLKRASSKPVAR